MFWKQILLLLIITISVVFSMPLPDDNTEHVHIKVHVPKSIHTHHHTVLKKIYIPVKEKHHEVEDHKYFDDAW